LPTFLAACLLAWLRRQCATQPPAEVYDFGPPPSGWPKTRWSSVALEIRAPYWFDSPAIEYRLLYENPLKLRSYAASRWAGRPGQLLAQRLRQQLGWSVP
jgi:cholesterol transport system auxiliary component